MMYENDIQKVNEWFEDEERIWSYHHTEEDDGEDVYAVSACDVEDFCDFLQENITDLISISGKIGTDGIWFSSEDLEKAHFY